MRHSTTATAMTGAIALGFATLASAQLEIGGDLLSNCAQIDALQKAGDFSQARDMARLCLDGLEQKLSGEVSALFPESVGAWSRVSLEENQALGFNNIAAVYEKGGVRVNVSLTGESGGGGNGPLGGLGGLFGGIAQQALQQSGRRVQVAGLPSSVQPDGTLTVPLEDGSLLMFASSSFSSADAALTGMGDLVNEFPVAEINTALK